MSPRRITLQSDPNPCRAYRWPEEPPCPEMYSGAHYCEKPGGHAGFCKCGACGMVGRRKDRSDATVAE